MNLFVSQDNLKLSNIEHMKMYFRNSGIFIH